MSRKFKLITSGLWVLLGRICVVGLALLTNAVLARTLTSEEMGVYFLILSLTAVGAVLAQFGMGTMTLRLVGESIGRKDLASAKAAIRFGISVVLAGAIAISGLGYFGLASWLASSVFDSVLLGSLTGFFVLLILLQPLQLYLSESFKGLQEIHLSTLFGGLIGAILNLGVVIVYWLLMGQLSLETVLVMLISVTLINSTFSALVLWRRLRLVEDTGSIARVETLRASMPIWVTKLFSVVLRNSDLWIVASVLGATSAALYGAASRLGAFVLFPLGLINSVVPSHIAELNVQENRTDLQKVLQHAVSLAIVPALLGCVVMVMFGEWVLELVFGSAYGEYAHVLAILSIGHLISVWSGSCGIVLTMIGQQKIALIIALSTGCLSLFFALIATPVFGVMGTAIAFVGFMSIQRFVLLALVKSKTGIWTCANPAQVGLVVIGFPKAMVQMFKEQKRS